MPGAETEVVQLRRELHEAHEQQTATFQVLEAISSSPGELEPLFASMLEKAVRICDAKFGVVYRCDGDVLRFVTMHNAPPALAALGSRAPFRPSPKHYLGPMMASKTVVQVADVRAEQGYIERRPEYVVAVELGGVRTYVAAPMLRHNDLIGVFLMGRQEVRPFTDKQIGLVKNFAAQAVIAIENARLLGELRQRTTDLTESLQQQTATSEILEVINRSAFDLKVVFESVAESSVRLCGANRGFIYRFDGELLRLAAAFNAPQKLQEWLEQKPIRAGRQGAAARAALERRTIHIPDVLADPEYSWGVKDVEAIRTVLAVPILKSDDLLGVMIIYHLEEVRPFTNHQIALVETFAGQAAIAIENVRLFEAEQQRTRELAQSLQDLRMAQDRLVQTQKLASLGQLIAGIAHEIKNPLNFVNNFSALSGELIEELREVLAQVSADEQARTRIQEITETLRGNLDKIEQHGKRADSIVKNMLLHSREGSDEPQAADINALVRESLNLAYHGARAEKAGFSITVKHELDPEAGALEVYPQEMTRALLNLISNGFYAATRRKIEERDETFEPVVSAATKNLGRIVQIRIRDNGTGIPSEVKEKMFNPFFTTKPPGEGTGLGLSIAHDVVVKQHGGRIDVETEPGAFTEIILTLPRGNGTAAKSEPE